MAVAPWRPRPWNSSQRRFPRPAAWPAASSGRKAPSFGTCSWGNVTGFDHSTHQAGAGGGAGPGGGADSGSVTVEAALGIASLIVVLAVSASGAAAALTQIRLVDAAREGARVASMSGAGDGMAASRAVTPGAQVSVEVSGEWATVEVSAPAWGLPGVDLAARAVARVEPGAVQ